MITWLIGTEALVTQQQTTVVSPSWSSLVAPVAPPHRRRNASQPAIAATSTPTECTASASAEPVASTSNLTAVSVLSVFADIPLAWMTRSTVMANTYKRYSLNSLPISLLNLCLNCVIYS